ncbi:EAL domain-containing protein [Thalassospira lucentensis]|uniref:EAL domain-containing protein n=1 Tax=Thalassospira lucentensis TaxID=168935 RepID=UPI00399D5AE3
MQQNVDSALPSDRGTGVDVTKARVSTDRQNGLLPDTTWKILIVDDDNDVHEATDFALSNVKILGRKLQLLHATNAEDAIGYLKATSDIAVIMLDVVMEEPDTGLRLVGKLRELGYVEPRIILRTGYPGQAPEDQVIRNYDINDYRTKDEMTRTRLITSLTTAIRSYDYIRSLSATRSGLEMVIEGTQRLYSNKNIDLFAEGVLTQIAAILRLRSEGAVCAVGTPTGDDSSSMIVMAGLGRFSGKVGAELRDIPDVDLGMVQDIAPDNVTPKLRDNKIALRFRTEAKRELVVYFEHNGALPSSDVVLLQVFASNLAICFENLDLINHLGELAFVDQRLGLPNHNAFSRELGGLVSGKTDKATVALVALEDAPQLAVAFGLAFAENVMSVVYDRMRDALGETILIARLGEYMLGVVDSTGTLEQSALEGVFHETFLMMGNRISVSASIGIVSGDPTNQKASDIDRAARSTLLRVIQDRPGTTMLFTPEIGDEVQNTIRMKSALQEAVLSKQFRFVFQPKINIKTGDVAGAEILCRWMMDGENIPPSVFIPIAERAGFSSDIALQSLEAVSDFWRDLQNAGLLRLPVAINLAVPDICNPDFVDVLTRQCEDSDLLAELVSFEITETQAISVDDDATRGVKALKDRGFNLWLDDFGTGYSSLSHLDSLPVDGIKIDKSFISTLTIETARGSVAATAKAMADNLGLRSIAEGVETREQHQIARLLGIEWVQGFYYARPMAPDAFIEWLKNWDLDAHAGS